MKLLTDPDYSKYYFPVEEDDHVHLWVKTDRERERRCEVCGKTRRLGVEVAFSNVNAVPTTEGN